MVQAGALGVDDAVRRILAEHTALADQAATLDRTANLYEAGMDSASTINVMFAIEEAFQFEVPETSLNRASFATLHAIAEVIRKATGQC